MGRDATGETVGLLTIEREQGMAYRSSRSRRITIVRALASSKVVAAFGTTWLTVILGCLALAAHVALSLGGAVQPFYLVGCGLFAVLAMVQARWFWKAHPRWQLVNCDEAGITVGRPIPWVRPRAVHVDDVDRFVLVPSTEAAGWFVVNALDASGHPRSLLHAKEDEANAAFDALQRWYDHRE